MSNLKKIIIAAVCIAVVVPSTLGIKYLLAVRKYKRIVETLQISDVNLNRISDGTYTGSFNAADILRARVEVTVAGHRITDIRLIENKNERGKPAEVIPERVVKAQSLDVDTVSGATNSSKVILKAIENALTGEI